MASWPSSHRARCSALLISTSTATSQSACTSRRSLGLRVYVEHHTRHSQPLTMSINIHTQSACWFPGGSFLPTLLLSLAPFATAKPKPQSSASAHDISNQCPGSDVHAAVKSNHAACSKYSNQGLLSSGLFSKHSVHDFMRHTECVSCSTSFYRS